MKKSLLLFMSLTLGISLVAQNRSAKQVMMAAQQQKNLSEVSSATGAPSLPVIRKTPLVISNVAVSDIPLGTAGNAFGGYTRPGRSILNYHSGLNTLTYTHRSCGAGCALGDGTANNGYIMYDWSKDGGTNWTNQQGPIYDGGGDQGRYPQGFIINPTGNSNPDSAYVVGHGPILAGAAEPWQGYFRGSAKLSDVSNLCDNSVLFQNTVDYRGLIPDAGCVVNSTNTIWISDPATSDGLAATTDYTDTILIHKGTWNATTKCVDYTTTKFYFPVISSANGKMMVTTHITFNSTGQTGYLSAVATSDLTFSPDSAYYITTWKTTDGGNTWGTANKVSMDVNTQMGTTGVVYSSGFQIDGSVDMNGKLHLIAPILDWFGPFSATLGAPAGTWGMFSIITDGTTNTVTLLDKPQTYRAQWTGTQAITEDSRGQVAVSLAEDKIFYVWFETDTTTFPGIGNKSPDAYVRMYDVATSSLDPAINITGGTVADGAVTFGNLADWASGTAAPYGLHIAYQGIHTSGDPTKEVQFHYLGGIAITDVKNIENDVLSIGDVYPSPTRGTSTIDLNIKKAGNANMEVVNTLGQVVYSANKHFTTGSQSITIDATTWNSGVYFFTIKSENYSLTKKLVKE